jgi:hypothetical protein
METPADSSPNHALPAVAERPLAIHKDQASNLSRSSFCLERDASSAPSKRILCQHHTFVSANLLPMTRERVTQPLEEQRRPGVMPNLQRSTSPVQGLAISLKPTAPEVIARREPQPERVQPQPRTVPKPVPLEPRAAPSPASIIVQDSKLDALESEADTRVVDATTQDRNDPTVEAPNNNRAALEAHLAQQAAERTRQQRLLERAQRIETSSRQLVLHGRGDLSGSGLGSVLTALSTDERLEVLAGVQSAHPDVWAKLEGLPVIRWDEDWQAFNGTTAPTRGSEALATLETRAVTNDTPQTSDVNTIALAGNAQGDVAALHRIYEIAKLQSANSSCLACLSATLCRVL